MSRDDVPRYETPAPIRILIPFGNIPFWGQERENIDCIEALLAEGGVDALFVTHAAWGHLHIQPELTKRGLRWTTAPYADRFGKGMPISRWIKNLWLMLRANFAFRRIVRSFRPTHLHVANPAMYLNFLPTIAWLGLPLIYRIGDEPELHHPLYRWLWHSAIVPRVIRFVCISRFIEQSVQALLGPDLPTTVIYGRPPRRLPLTDPPPLPRFAQKTMVFVYIGRISAAKGVDVLVETFFELTTTNDVALCLAGDYAWQNPFAQRLISETSRRKLSDRIVFLGERHDADRIYAIAQVHVCPTVDKEALGLVVLEAKQAGLPSIVFSTGGLPEMIENDTNGIICTEKTSRALKQACLRYIDNPEMALRHGMAARSSLARFGLMTFGQRLKSVYEQARQHIT